MALRESVTGGNGRSGERSVRALPLERADAKCDFSLSGITEGTTESAAATEIRPRAIELSQTR